MSVNDPRPTGLARRVAAEDFPLMPADDRVRAPSLAGRTAGARADRGPAMPSCAAVTVHVTAPRRATADWQLRWSSADGSRGLRMPGGDCITLRAQDPPPVVRPDQHQAGHPGRQHRPQPRPLPGQAAPPRGHRRADQPPRRDHSVRPTARSQRSDDQQYTAGSQRHRPGSCSCHGHSIRMPACRRWPEILCAVTRDRRDRRDGASWPPPRRAHARWR
jgi:hypothetical protein